jgi:hypothetical protein
MTFESQETSLIIPFLSLLGYTEVTAVVQKEIQYHVTRLILPSPYLPLVDKIFVHPNANPLWR